MQFSKSTLYILIAAAAALAVGSYVVVLSQRSVAPAPPAPLPQAQDNQEGDEDEIPRENWKTYTNTRYGYQFQYPTEVSTEGPGGGPIREAWRIFVRDPTPPADPGVLGAALFFADAFYSHQADELQFPALRLPLKEFAETIWQMNRDAKESSEEVREGIGPLEAVTVDGKEAYQFTVTDSYVDGRSGYILTREHRYIFTAREDIKYIIFFPTEEPMGQAILESFEFTN